jgi:hypothetical protein
MRFLTVMVLDEKCVSSRYTTVTTIVTEEKAPLSGFLGRETLVTLVTVDCGCFLKGAHFYFAGSLTPSKKPDKPDTRTRKSHSYAVIRAITNVGFFRSPRRPDTVTRQQERFNVGFEESIVGS